MCDSVRERDREQERDTGQAGNKDMYGEESDRERRETFEEPEGGGVCVCVRERAAKRTGDRER